MKKIEEGMKKDVLNLTEDVQDRDHEIEQLRNQLQEMGGMYKLVCFFIWSYSSSFFFLRPVTMSATVPLFVISHVLLLLEQAVVTSERQKLTRSKEHEYEEIIKELETKVTYMEDESNKPGTDSEAQSEKVKELKSTNKVSKLRHGFYWLIWNLKEMIYLLQVGKVSQLTQCTILIGEIEKIFYSLHVHF